MNFNKKNVGMILLALGAFVVFEGTGLSSQPKQFISMLTTKVKGFFAGLFTKSTTSS